MCSGISEPEAKLPGRSEIEITIASGNSVNTRNTTRNPWAANTRHRWDLLTTMGMTSSCAGSALVLDRDLGEPQVDDRQDRHDREDHGGDRRRQAELLPRVLERDPVRVADQDV